jgi:hypothetical protein
LLAARRHDTLFDERRYDYAKIGKRPGDFPSGHFDAHQGFQRLIRQREEKVMNVAGCPGPVAVAVCTGLLPRPPVELASASAACTKQATLNRRETKP